MVFLRLILISIMILSFTGCFDSKEKITSLIDENQVETIVKDALSISGDVTVQKLGGGSSDAQIFTVHSDSQKYVIRFLTHKSLKEREWEISSLQIASKSDYGPHVYFADVDRGIIIMEFLPHQNISNELRRSDLLYELLAKFLKKIHNGPKFENIQDRNVFDVINKIIQELKNKCDKAIPLSKIENIIKIIHQTLASHLEVAPCHNDLNLNNLIFLGNEFKAIDYEYASQENPYFDIATIAIFYCVKPAYENILLSTYLERQPSAKEMAKLYLMKQVAFIVYGLTILQMTPELYQYAELKVPSYIEFLKEWSEEKINLENPETKLKFAKVMINNVIANSESQKFSDALNVLTQKK